MSKRSDRVEAQVSRVISGILLKGLRDKRVQPVSITAVTCSPDLRHAKIFVVPLAGKGDSTKILEGLNHAAGFVNYQLAKELSMKYSPKVKFLLDEHFFESIDLIERLEQQESVREDDLEENPAEELEQISEEEGAEDGSADQIDE